MKVIGLYAGLALLLSVEPGIAAQDAPVDATRSEAAALAVVSIKESGAAARPAPENRAAVAAVPLAAPMAIAPAPAIKAGDEMFIGTGDGSNGYWVRP